MYVCVHVYIYIYIYIERERERETYRNIIIQLFIIWTAGACPWETLELSKNISRGYTYTYIYIYIYIYLHMCTRIYLFVQSQGFGIRSVFESSILEMGPAPGRLVLSKGVLR